jgi:hypothetical protein
MLDGWLGLFALASRAAPIQFPTFAVSNLGTIKYAVWRPESAGLRRDVGSMGFHYAEDDSGFDDVRKTNRSEAHLSFLYRPHSDVPRHPSLETVGRTPY